MVQNNCECKNDVCIIEAEFGEIFPASKAKFEEEGKRSSSHSSEYSDFCGYECDYATCGVDNDPIIIKSYTMCNANRMRVKIITLGATIVSIKCPDKYGDVADVLLGFDDLKSYMDPTLNRFVGCILGRCANRIKDGTFRLKNMDYLLEKNDSNRHHIHGGTNGLGRRVWDAHIEEDSYLVMSYLSADGEEGYPGSLLTTIKFKLTKDNRLEINMRATTSKPTIVNLSYGTLFNLAGHDKGEDELRMHQITLNCDRWTFSEYDDPVPTGGIRGVGGTIMDLRIPRFMGDLIEMVPPGEGFDHNFCVVRKSQPEVAFVSRVFHAASGRYLEVYSDQPGVQFYTGGRLPPYPLPEDKSDRHSGDEATESSLYECPDPCDCHTDSSRCSKLPMVKMLEFLPGKCCARYRKFGAFSVQPQNYPNAVNTVMDLFGERLCCVLRPSSGRKPALFQHR